MFKVQESSKFDYSIVNFCMEMKIIITSINCIWSGYNFVLKKYASFQRMRMRNIFLIFILLIFIVNRGDAKSSAVDYCDLSMGAHDYFLSKSLNGNVFKKRRDNMSLLLGNVSEEFNSYINKKIHYLEKNYNIIIGINNKENVNSVLFFTENVRNFLERNKRGVMPFFVSEQLFDNRLSGISDEAKSHFEVAFYNGYTSGVLAVMKNDAKRSEKIDFIDDFFLFSLGILPNRYLEKKYNAYNQSKNEFGISVYDVFFIKLLYSNSFSEDYFLSWQNFYYSHQEFFGCTR